MTVKYANPKNAPEPKVGDLRVWWNPQIGTAPQIYFPVPTVHEGVRLLDSLARYDLFQLEHRIKPDFANVGGLEQYAAETFCGDGEDNAPGWQSWETETDDDHFDDPAEYVAKYPETAADCN